MVSRPLSRRAPGALPVFSSRNAAGAVGASWPCPARSRPGRTGRPAGRRRTPRDRQLGAEQVEPSSLPNVAGASRAPRAASSAARRGSRSSSSSQCSVWRSKSSVRRRVGGVGDVHADPPVRRQIRTVDGAEGELAALRRARARRAPCPAASAILVPRSTGRAAGRCAARRRCLVTGRRSAARQRAAVRRSCHTIARWIGSPVARSQNSVVSRWLVMPIAAMLRPASSARPSTSRVVSSTVDHRSSGSCSTQPEAG